MPATFVSTQTRASLSLPAGLALLASSHVLMAQALALLISCRPQLYIRYREAFAIALMLNLAWVVRILALHGGTPILKYHDGSTLKLLLLMVAGSPSFWVCIYALHSRPLLRWMRLALPLLAVLPVGWSPTRRCLLSATCVLQCASAARLLHEASAARCLHAGPHPLATSRPWCQPPLHCRRSSGATRASVGGRWVRSQASRKAWMLCTAT